MDAVTLITFVFTAGVVWGGLTFFLSRAVKFEKMKKEISEE